jgi:hypothetical protein
LGSTAIAHSAGTPARSNASTSNAANLFTNTGAIASYFSAISPSMFTVVFNPANTKMLDNGVETLYGGFFASSGLGFNVAANTGQWALGGDEGEYFNGTIYYVLMYATELTNAQIQQNVLAVNAILSDRGLDPSKRTDGNHTQNILLIEGTSIDNGWGGAGMSLTYPFEIHVTAQWGIPYGGGINSYTLARDSPLINPSAHRNVILLGAPTNDFVGADAGKVEDNFTTAVSLAREEGWKEVYCGTMLSRIGTAFGGVTFDSYHDQYNTWLRGNWEKIGCSGIFDPAANPLLGADGAYEKTSMFPDGVHPSPAGYAIYALAAQNAINGAKAAASPHPLPTRR